MNLKITDYSSDETFCENIASPHFERLTTVDIWLQQKHYTLNFTVISPPKISRYFLIVKKATRDLNPRALAFCVQMVQMHTY